MGCQWQSRCALQTFRCACTVVHTQNNFRQIGPIAMHSESNLARRRRFWNRGAHIAQSTQDVHMAHYKAWHAGATDQICSSMHAMSSVRQRCELSCNSLLPRGNIASCREVIPRLAAHLRDTDERATGFFPMAPHRCHDACSYQTWEGGREWEREEGREGEKTRFGSRRRRHFVSGCDESTGREKTR